MSTTAAPQHSPTALDIARVTGWRLDEFAADHDWSAVGVGPVGQHRDSEALDLSNFEVIYSDLRERFGEAVDVARFGHWAVGWVEEIVWDAGNLDVALAVREWRDALDSYPVADEMHYSELEWKYGHPAGDPEHCYSEYCRDNGECSEGRELA